MATRFIRTARAANETAVLYTYRQLLRATYTAFKGDTATLHASRKFARDQFRASKELIAGSEEAGAAMQHVQGVITILRQNIVQGEHKGDDKYKLRIHDQIERGDNASAKKMQGSVKSFKEIKNSVF